MTRECKTCGTSYRYTLSIRDGSHPFYCRACQPRPEINVKKEKTKRA